MDRSGIQRIIPIILVLIIVGLVIAALVSIGRTFFGGEGSSPSPTPQVDTGKQALISTLPDRSVRMSVRGPLVATENFRSYTVTISPDSRNLTMYKGYSGEVIDSSQQTNTVAAYEQFVYSLDRAKLMDGTALTGDANDTRGVCATGELYQFDILQGANVVKSLWTSTCSGSLGSLKANLSQVQRLFRAQIPDAVKLTSKINL